VLAETDTVADVDSQAAELIAKAREAMLNSDNSQAVFLLERVLRLPPNSYSPEAQELAGVARERLHEIDKAKQEYELFLRLYPQGEDAERVRQRLAALSAMPNESVLKSSKRATAAASQSMLTGNIFQYYYRGNSKIEMTPLALNANPLQTETLSLLDQSALVSNIMLNARHRNTTAEHRLVFRDTLTQDFVYSKNNRHRLTTAYYDFRQRQNKYSLRLGRQPASSSGVFGRFDGVNAGVLLFPQWRLNTVAGQLTDNFFDVSPQFYGVNLDMGVFADHWSGNLYGVQQTVDKRLDRRAIGAELRYAESNRYLYAATDYDVEFSILNMLMANAMASLSENWQWNISADYRRYPFLQMSNAVLSNPTLSYSNMAAVFLVDELRQRALAVTARSYNVASGLNYKFSARWQLNGDIRATYLSGTQGIDTVPSATSTGNVYTGGGQIVVNDVLNVRDSSAFGVIRVINAHYNGWSWSLIERLRSFKNWTLEGAVRYYDQRSDIGIAMNRWTPNAKINYRWRDDVEFEFEGSVEYSAVSGPLQTDKTRRVFGSAGYIWSF
jgi:hypothetical protein